MGGELGYFSKEDKTNGQYTLEKMLNIINP